MEADVSAKAGGGDSARIEAATLYAKALCLALAAVGESSVISLPSPLHLH